MCFKLSQIATKVKSNNCVSSSPLPFLMCLVWSTNSFRSKSPFQHSDCPCKQISIFSSFHYHIHDLRHIHHTIEFTTASTIANYVAHSRLDYCNSLYHSHPVSNTRCLQQIQNALARAITRTPKYTHHSDHFIISMLNSAYSSIMMSLLNLYFVTLTYYLKVTNLNS